MQTLIELFDKRPIANVLGTEMFRPEQTVFLCDKEISENRALQQKLKNYFKQRGLETQILFRETATLNAASVKRALETVVQQYPDCALDISGGSDAALFAGGLLCAEQPLPVFTYSRKRNTFFDIQNAPFAHNVLCDVLLSAPDCFAAAGGSVRQGRVDNTVLEQYTGKIDGFFKLFLKYRHQWQRIVSYLQRVSPTPKEGPLSLFVVAPWQVKGDRGMLTANEEALQDLSELGFLRELELLPGEQVRFSFADAQIRAWLRDVGSVLELYVWKACVKSGRYQDVRVSVVVDWDGQNTRDGVSNEIDVVAVRGIKPVFISCKTSEIRTEALNELAILRDRFGGEVARAIIVSAERACTVTRNRAAELDIEVVDLDELDLEQLSKRFL